MSWKFNPFTVQFDYYESNLYAIVEHDTDTTLETTDLNKIHVMDASGGERLFLLPSADTAYIGQWIVLGRKAKTDSLIRVWAKGSDVIFNSGAGGYLECGDTDHDYCLIFLMILASGVWGNPSFGIWSTH